MTTFIILLTINIILYFYIVRRFLAFLKGLNISKENITKVLYLNPVKKNKEIGEAVNYLIFNKHEAKKNE
jgi:hypothetical protein